MNLLWAALTILLVLVGGVLGMILILGIAYLVVFSVAEYIEARVRKTTTRKARKKPKGKAKG